MAVPFFDINRQNIALKVDLDKALSAVIEKGRFILGENVTKLEEEVAAYCGTKYAVGVASGTDALHLSLRACGICPGDEVITSPFTFVATADAIAYCGATPVFVDIKPNTFNIDPRLAEKAITDKTKAILPVHIYGQACEMDILAEICKKNDLFLVEDSAQAIGAEYNGKKAGSTGDISGFSFFPTKNLGCFGDGGMVTTNDDALANEVRVLRGHGSSKTYHYDIVGYNSRLDELQAAVIRAKLPHLDAYSAARRKNATLYRKQLKEVDEITLPHEDPKAKHAYNQFTIRVKDRNELFEFLKVKDVGRMIYYPLSLHLQPAFKTLGYKEGSLPESEAAQCEVLSLPIFPELTENEILEACKAIKEFYKK
ncbi:MAG: DegT/DnrJ/EryC1/StrS family aminotransferase [Candidatus Margulisiibacteriota bacterium]|nr:DegT/DnrJ/EryC1/StrS family aminotransferase [Candidatus Margulisiibacteriota bacterium]